MWAHLRYAGRRASRQGRGRGAQRRGRRPGALLRVRWCQKHWLPPVASMRRPPRIFDGRRSGGNEAGCRGGRDGRVRLHVSTDGDTTRADRVLKGGQWSTRNGCR